MESCKSFTVKIEKKSTMLLLDIKSISIIC